MPNGDQTLEEIRREARPLEDVIKAPQAVSFAALPEQFRREFGAEQEAIKLQTELGKEQAEETGRARFEMAGQILERRGLGGTVFGESLLQPTIQQNIFERSQAELRDQTALDENRILRTSEIRSRLASGQMADITRKFNQQVQNFQRSFGEFKSTAQSKISDEAEDRQLTLQRDFDRTVRGINQSLTGPRAAGRLVGSILGGIAGALLGGPIGLAAGREIGGGLGGLAGGLGGQERAREFARRF